MIPDRVVEEVRARADLVEVIGEQVQLKRSGHDFKGLCPFHDEKTPSFYVVPNKGFYNCFGCGESGDVFTFLMKRSGLTFNDAVRQLAARVGVEVPSEAESRRPDPHASLYEAVAFAVDQFQEWLAEEGEGQHARAYLEGREIDKSAVDRFALGWAPDDWRRLREAAALHDIGDDVLLEAGLIKESERGDEPYDRFRGRIIFPIARIDGRYVAMGGRAIGRPREGVPKYLNSPETPIYHKGAILYGLNWSKAAIRREGSAVVVEGYMDYISLAARGASNVVAGLGTAMTMEQADLLARYTSRAYLLYDSDGAGMRATFKTADALLRAGVHPLVVELPAGQDPDSVVRHGGIEALRPAMDGAKDVLERKLEMLEARGYFNDIEGARRAVDRLLPTIRATLDPTLRDLYLDRTAQRAGVRRETLEAELTARSQSTWSGAGQRNAGAGRTRSSGRSRSRPNRRGPWQPPPPPVDWRDEGNRIKRETVGAEHLLLLLLLRDPACRPQAAAMLAPRDFVDAGYRDLFRALTAEPSRPVSGDGPMADAAPSGQVLGDAHALTAAAKKRLGELRADREEIADAEQSFRQAVADLRVPGLFLRLDELDSREAQAQSFEESAALMQRRQAVLRELRELGVEAELGFKTTRRHRRRARQRGRVSDGTPTTEV